MEMSQSVHGLPHDAGPGEKPGVFGLLVCPLCSRKWTVMAAPEGTPAFEEMAERVEKLFEEKRHAAQ